MTNTKSGDYHIFFSISFITCWPFIYGTLNMVEKRLAVSQTPLENHLLKLVWKTHKLSNQECTSLLSRSFLCEVIYIYIYIYIYLLIYYLPAFTVTKKKKKPPGTRDKNISNHRPEGKEKYHRTKKKKKEKTNPVTPVEKNQEICSQLVKRKIKPTVNTAMLQLQECSTRVEPITKLT